MHSPVPTASPEIPLDGSACRKHIFVALFAETRFSCPNPIPDPETNQDQGWLLEDGAPPGHGFCGHWWIPCRSRSSLPDSYYHSENLVALRAPSTSRCDFCQVSFCGIGIPERCHATSLLSQHLNGFSDLGDLIQAADIYDCFEGNTVEVDILFDYLTEHLMTPKQIYQDVRVSLTFRLDRLITFPDCPTNSEHP